MKAIVTGANGFVGSYVVSELLEHGYEVLAIDVVDRPTRLRADSPCLSYLKLDISDIALLQESGKYENYDFFFHFAWRGSAGPERGDEEIQAANAVTTAKCLRVASKMGCRRFVVAGTITEFESNEVVYQDDSAPSLPYIYGAAKSFAHALCKPIANALNIDLIWGYISNAYGPGELSPRLINTTIRNVIEKKPLQFTSGTQNYDFVYVEDVALAFRLMAEKGKKNRSYMIGSGDAKPLRSFLEDAVFAMNPRANPMFGDIAYTGMPTPLSVFSIANLQKDCQFQPKVPFKEGIMRTYKFWVDEYQKMGKKE